ncbi:MAG: hypothetical protein IPK64_06215 [bacterium]|nr:hypothetical protein [bacterium]
MHRLPPIRFVVMAATALLLASCVGARAIAAGTLADNAGSAAGSGPSATELQRAGRVAEALEALHRDLAARPDDPLLLYNQACLENRLGRGARAVASLQAALAAGFDDLAHAAADPDLALGEAAPQLARLIADQRTRRGEMSVRRGARIAQGVSTVLALEPAPDGGAPDGSRVAVTWRPAHLELRLEAPGGRGRWLPGGDAVPWNGTGGLLVVLGPHAGDGTGETADAFHFGFGIEKNVPVGAMYVSSVGAWQRVRELTPKVRSIGPDGLVVDVAIPWTAIAPYHPLVDPALGLNVALIGRGGDTGPRLMPAPVLGRAAEPRHLTARLDCETTTAAHGSFAGRTPSSLVRGGQLALNLVAVSAAAGRGTLRLAFSDSDGNPLLDDVVAEDPVELDAGVTRVNLAVDFEQLRPGPCHVSADLQLPDGTRAQWATWLLNLGRDWEADYGGMIAPLTPDERPTALYYLERVGAAVAAHHGRRDPGALATTMADLNHMLARCAQTGSLLPDEGVAPFVYLSPGGEPRLCRLVFPPGRPSGAPLRPVVMAGHSDADAPRLADRILRFLAADGSRPSRAAGQGAVWPVFVIAPAAVDQVEELDTCVHWAGARFGGGTCLLSVQQAGVAPALELVARGQTGVAGLQLFIDGLLASWPAERDVPPAPAVPVSWVEFVQETAVEGGGRALAAELRRRGWRLQVTDVAGGANFTQVADRACLWEASLAGTRPGR